MGIGADGATIMRWPDSDCKLSSWHAGLEPGLRATTVLHSTAPQREGASEPENLAPQAEILRQFPRGSCVGHFSPLEYNGAV